MLEHGKAIDIEVGRAAMALARTLWGETARALAELVDRPGEERDALRRWHILQTEPRQEKQVESFLVDKRFKVFLPTELKLVRSGVRRLILQRIQPMFPGYVFVRFNRLIDGPRTAVIHRAPGIRAVHSFLEMNGDLATVDDAELAIVEQISKQLMIPFRAPVAPNAHFATGETVKVLEGPFANFWGVVSRIEGQERIKVLVSLFGRATLASFKASQIEAA
jgi:transcription antitermination factor NusG